MPSFIPPPVLNSASSLQIVDNDQAVLTSSTDRTLRLWSARGELIGKCHFAPVTPLFLSDCANGDKSRERCHAVIEVMMLSCPGWERWPQRVSTGVLEVNGIPEGDSWLVIECTAQKPNQLFRSGGRVWEGRGLGRFTVSTAFCENHKLIWGK